MFAALGPLRYALLEAGRRLVGRGELGGVDDIWYLEQDEVSGLLRGQSCEADIARWRGEFHWAQGNPLDRVLGPHRVLSREQARHMVWVPEARRAYQRFHTECFWSFDPDDVIEEKDVPWVAQRLMEFGGRQGWEIGAKLCR